jgi:hypothetical protein
VNIEGKSKFQVIGIMSVLLCSVVSGSYVTLQSAKPGVRRKPMFLCREINSIQFILI